MCFTTRGFIEKNRFNARFVIDASLRFVIVTMHVGIFYDIPRCFVRTNFLRCKRKKNITLRLVFGVKLDE